MAVLPFQRETIRTVLPSKRRGSAAPWSLTWLPRWTTSISVSRRVVHPRAEPERRRGDRAAADAGGVHGRLADDRVQQRGSGEVDLDLQRAAGELVAGDDLRAGRRADAQRERRDLDVGQRVEDRLQRRLQQRQVAGRRECLRDVDGRRVDRLRVQARARSSASVSIAWCRARRARRAASAGHRRAAAGSSRRLAVTPLTRAAGRRAHQRGQRRADVHGPDPRTASTPPPGSADRSSAGSAGSGNATDSSPTPAAEPATCESGSAPVNVVRAKSAPPVTGSGVAGRHRRPLCGARDAIGGDGSGRGRSRRSRAARWHRTGRKRRAPEKRRAGEHGRADGERQRAVHRGLSRQGTGAPVRGL